MTTDQHGLAGDAGDAAADPAEVSDFADRVFTAALGAFELLSIHVGDRLGWYRALAERGPLGSGELATLTGTHERYAREWLEQQAAYGLLEVEHADAAPSDRRFALPAAHAAVLVDRDSLDHLAPLARMFAGAAAQIGPLLDAYRTGGGVPWDAFGADARDAQGDMNRPWFDRRLADSLAGVPRLHEVLSRPGLASPTSDAGTAGRRSRSHARTRWRSSTATTSMAWRSPRPASMPRRPASPTASGSTSWRGRGFRRERSTTPRSSSKRCTTCPGPWRCSRRSAPPCAPTAPS
jgi:hypothetical protein